MLDLRSREKHQFLTSFNKENSVKNPQLIPSAEETKVEFLLLVSRAAYRARFASASAVHVAEVGEWNIEIQGEDAVITFPKGRILDPQNRAFVADMLSVRPIRIVVPFGYPVFVSSLGVHARYYLKLPRACSLTFEMVRR